MRGLNEDEVCNFVALTQDKVSLGCGNTAGRLSHIFNPTCSLSLININKHLRFFSQ